MLGPTVFFLTVMNFIYGFFETFAIIDAVTKGGPPVQPTFWFTRSSWMASSISTSALRPRNRFF